ncbi:MAG TPA: hypothetical protein VGC15_15485 [Acetobacteraceae bacterium]
MTQPVLFLKASIKGYTRSDGTTVAPHEDSRPSASKWYGDQRHVQEIMDVVRSSPHRHHGLRIMSPHPVTDASATVAIGDTLPHSYRWNDGNATNRALKGTSTLRVRTEADARRAITLAGMYYGKQVVLVGSHEKRTGPDEQEAVLTTPKVLASWHRKEVGIRYSVANPGADHSD